MTGPAEDDLPDIIAAAAQRAGFRIATPEETQAIVDQAVTHVMEEEERLLATELVRTVTGKPEIPKADNFYTVLNLMGRQIFDMVADVTDPTVSYGPNRDGYGKCVEVMWRAVWLAMEVVARELHVTGYQHSAATLTAFAKLRGIEGSFMVANLEDALFPASNPAAKVAQWLDEPENREWLGEQARERIERDGDRAHPTVLAHWRELRGRGR